MLTPYGSVSAIAARRAVAVGPVHGEFDDTLCQVALATGHPDEALAACERAHLIRPTDAAIELHLERARRAVSR